MTILGSTGSIGLQVLDLVEAHPDQFSVFALSGYHNVDLLLQQCRKFRPRFVVLVDSQAAHLLSQQLRQENIETVVLSGKGALSEIVSDPEVRIVVSAIVGAAGLLPTMAAISAGKRVLLANKESLVMAGELMMSAVRTHQVVLLPIDSEHNAVFQCLPQSFLPGDESPDGISSIVLTASGGPFRLMPLEDLASVSPEQAVAHPNWSMGAKISVDSATMMNKGLEVIEAHYLFGMSSDQIGVLVHPQSWVHAFVHYEDGSIITHIALPDMHIPIAHALAWPGRMRSGVKHFNFIEASKMEFERPDPRRYPCLQLAYEALRLGGTAPAILNAANEVAVLAFLSGRLSFNSISIVVSKVMEQLSHCAANSLEVVLDSDREARACADKIITTSNAMVP